MKISHFFQEQFVMKGQAKPTIGWQKYVLLLKHPTEVVPVASTSLSLGLNTSLQ